MLGVLHVKGVKKSNLEAGGLKQQQQMVGDPVHVACDDIPFLDTHAEKPLEQDGKFGGPSQDDFIEIPAFLFHLQHHINQTGQRTIMLTGRLHDIQAYVGNANNIILVGRPCKGCILVEHPSCDQFHRIVIDFFLVLEVLIDGGPRNAALGCNQGEIGVTIPLPRKHFQCCLQDFLLSLLMIYLLGHASLTPWFRYKTTITVQYIIIMVKTLEWIWRISMVLSLLAGMVLLLLLIMIIRTIALSHTTGTPVSQSPVVDGSTACAVLGKAIRFKTISHQDPTQTEWNEFAGLADLFAQAYPLCETYRIKEGVGTYNLVYCFNSENSDALPILLTAHLDVVGAREQAWSHPPFSGIIEKGFLYGRGSFDCKGQAVAILSAFESLLTAHKKPNQTYYVAFGCDEECNGSSLGASTIASYFEQQGLRFAFVLDEGGVVSQRYIKGFDQDIAVVGVAEKGYMDVQLSAQCSAGHSSTPAFPTALGMVSQAVYRLENHAMPARLTAPVKAMLYSLGAQGTFLYRLLFLNLWITRPLLVWIFSKNPTLNALVRTTVAPTMMQASNQSNVIAEQASATVNIRLLPTQSQTEVLAWMQRIIANPKVDLKVLRFTPPSEISPSQGEAFSRLEKTIITCFDRALVTPYLMLGATDARKYQNLSPYIYRFTPMLMAKNEVARMHGVDERISEENIKHAVSFYTALISG